MSATEGQPLVELRDLTVSYDVGGRRVVAVSGASLSVSRGETVAVVGESGSGKTTTAQALLGLLPSNGRIDSGSVVLDGADVTKASEREWRAVRGAVVGFVPQDPATGLNPTRRIGAQVAEAVRQHRKAPKPIVDARVIELLEHAGIPNPSQRAQQYPHQLSGGLRQRVLIAIALASEPRVIVADEPTSALDVTVQRRILDHLESAVRERGIALIIITHDLAVAGDRADRVIVMKEGSVVEAGPARAVLAAPSAAYTRQLVEAAPALADGGRVIAHHVDVVPGPELLSLTNVTKTFPLPRARSGPRELVALADVSLSVRQGQTLGLVGESGSGKSTALRVALGLERPTAGRVKFDGRDITGLGWKELRPLRRDFQLVQQNPYASIDPRFTVRQAIVEPLDAFKIGDRASRKVRAEELIDRVALPRTALDRTARELSGGQRQRVAIARALALAPRLLFLDEPVSALDVSVQDQILGLLTQLQADLGLTYVFVSHDLAVVGRLAHEVAVLRDGVLVESGPAERVFANPQHEHTRELLAAVPGQSTTKERVNV